MSQTLLCTPPLCPFSRTQDVSEKGQSPEAANTPNKIPQTVPEGLLCGRDQWKCFWHSSSSRSQNNNMKVVLHYLHFMDEETKVSEDYRTWKKQHRWEMDPGTGHCWKLNRPDSPEFFGTGAVALPPAPSSKFLRVLEFSVPRSFKCFVFYICRLLVSLRFWVA